MDHCQGAEINEMRRNGGFLSGDENARSVVALLSDNGEERFSQCSGSQGICHVLWTFSCGLARNVV
jgi:hypothetical protein